MQNTGGEYAYCYYLLPVGIRDESNDEISALTHALMVSIVGCVYSYRWVR